MALVVAIEALPGRVDGASYWNWWIFPSSVMEVLVQVVSMEASAPMIGMEVWASVAVMHDGCFGINSSGGSHSTGN